MHKDETLSACKILVVDDNSTNLLLIEDMLEWAGYTNVSTTRDPEQVLAISQQFLPDLIILDLHMPKMSGYEVLEQLQAKRQQGDYLPILVFTADISTDAKQKALSLGASDFLTKPGDATEIMLRVANFLKMRMLHCEIQSYNRSLEEMVQERTAELEAARLEVIEKLARAAEYRDDDTGQHTKRVGDLSASIAAELNLPPDRVELIRQAALLHDVGKIGVPDKILLKPGKLTDEEFSEMKRHTMIGGNILAKSQSPLLQLAEQIALTHHERWDGTGYCGLKCEEIPIEGRIVSVADVFDALTHERPYKDAWPIEKAIDEITSLSGQFFDPKVVEAFLNVIQRDGLRGEQAA